MEARNLSCPWELLAATVSILKPPPRLKVSEWADTYRVLSPESSAEPGKFRTSRMEHTRDMMDSLCEAPTVVFMTSSQVAKTTIFENIIGRFIHLDPCPMLMINPTLEMSETFSKDRFDPMVRDTSVLTPLVATRKSRDNNSTILHKNFRGGHLTLAGANSSASLASRPVRGVLFDEVDRFPVEAGNEGDPIKLAMRRAARFWNRWFLLASTPTIKDESRIEKAFLLSDQRRREVACPHCGGYQVLVWAQVKWRDNDAKTAYYECTHCKQPVHEHERAAMVANGRWVKTNPEGRYPGFHIWELYAPGASITEIVQEFLDCKGDPEQLKVFVNTVLGELWINQLGKQPEWATLKARAEPYPILEAPMRCLLLTAAIDVQDDRLSMSIWGWGRGEEAWAIYACEIYESPGQERAWEMADDLLTRPIRHASGVDLQITACAVDTGGHHTNDAYNFVRRRPGRNLYAIKGSSNRGAPVIGKPTLQEVTWRGQTLKKGVRLWPVGTDTIKSIVYGRLGLEEVGPGFFHFPIGLEDEFYQQLCSEKQVSRYVKGFEIREWVKTRRNERLDELVYAYAVATVLGLPRLNWDNLEAAILPKQEQPKRSAEPDDGELVGAASGRSPGRAGRRRGAGAKRNFATSW